MTKKKNQCHKNFVVALDKFVPSCHSTRLVNGTVLSYSAYLIIFCDSM